MLGFLEDTKNFGLIAMVLSGIMLISGVLCLFGLNPHASILMGIGLIISAAVSVTVFYGIWKGSSPIHIGNLFEDVTSFFGVISTYLAVMGLVELITGIFSIIGGQIRTGIFNIIVAVVIFFAIYEMNQRNGHIWTKIVFYLLLVIIILGILSAIPFFYPIVTIPYAVMSILLYVALLFYLTSEEVRAKLGI